MVHRNWPVFIESSSHYESLHLQVRRSRLSQASVPYITSIVLAQRKLASSEQVFSLVESLKVSAKRCELVAITMSMPREVWMAVLRWLMQYFVSARQTDALDTPALEFAFQQP